MALALGTAVQASDETFHGRWYIGLAGGTSQMDPDLAGTGLTLTEDQSEGGKVVIGRDLTHRLSLEAYAADLGAVEIGASDEITYQVFGAQLVMHLYNNGSSLGRYFRDGLSVYAKLGAGSLSTDATVTVEEPDDFHVSAGLGVSGLIAGGVTWRIEAEAYGEDAALVSLGLIKRFGDVPDPSPPSVDYFKSQRGTARDDNPSPLDTPVLVPEPDGDGAVSEGGLDDTAIDLSPGTSGDETVVAVGVDGVDGVDAGEVADDGVLAIEPTAEAGETLADGAVSAVVAADPVNTLEATAIETEPAPLDSDGDGVVNEIDRCADTPPGKVVDDAGCSFAGVVEGLYFASSSSDLDSASRAVLDAIIFELLKHPTVLLEVQAHTDNRGPARGNLELSQARAEAVVRYMIQGGISSTRLRPVGYGESRPAFQNATEEGRRRNRRVEFRTIEQPRQ